MNYSQVDAKPWLSVVIPSYNGEKWIGSALHSIAAEAADGVEVLVIDSSSTRATLDIAVTYSNRLRLRTFERQDLKTWHAKTNFGVEVANAAHICWLGVDDVWLPGRVCAVRGWINEAPDALLHLAPCAFIDRDGRTVGLWRCPFHAKVKSLPILSWSACWCRISPLRRRRYFEGMGGSSAGGWMRIFGIQPTGAFGSN